MHLAERGYALAVLTAVLAITGTWASDPALAGLWYLPAVLLLAGLALEGLLVRRTSVRPEIETASRALLGREQQATYAFRNESSRPVTLQFATAVPAGIEAEERTHVVRSAARRCGSRARSRCSRCGSVCRCGRRFRRACSAGSVLPGGGGRCSRCSPFPWRPIRCARRAVAPVAEPPACALGVPLARAQSCISSASTCGAIPSRASTGRRLRAPRDSSRGSSPRTSISMCS